MSNRMIVSKNLLPIFMYDKKRSNEIFLIGNKSLNLIKLIKHYQNITAFKKFIDKYSKYYNTQYLNHHINSVIEDFLVNNLDILDKIFPDYNDDILNFFLQNMPIPFSITTINVILHLIAKMCHQFGLNSIEKCYKKNIYRPILKDTFLSNIFVKKLPKRKFSKKYLLT